MSSLIFSTFSNLARARNLDRRHPALLEIQPDAYLKFGSKLLPIYALPKNGAQISANSTGLSTKE